MYLLYWFLSSQFENFAEYVLFFFLNSAISTLWETGNGKHYVELFHREVKYELFSQQQGETFNKCKSFQTTIVCYVSSIYHYNLWNN